MVSKIDQLFSELDNGIKNLEQAQEKLAIYRQAVLKKAFEGELKRRKLRDVAVVKRGKSKHRPRNDSSLFGGKYPFIQTGEIKAANGGIIKNYQKTYSEKGLAQSKLWSEGTLCLTIAANIGETAFLGFDACFPDSVVGIKPNTSLLNHYFLNFYVQKIKQQMDLKAPATAQKNINIKFLEELNIPVPVLEQQEKIVQEIEYQFSICDALEENIKKGLQQAISLKQSILKKAFDGKLLSQDELAACQKEPDWEPANELLKKIEAEKE